MGFPGLFSIQNVGLAGVVIIVSCNWDNNGCCDGCQKQSLLFRRQISNSVAKPLKESPIVIVLPALNVLTPKSCL